MERRVGIFAGLGKHRGKRRQPNIALVTRRRTRGASNNLDGVFAGGHGAPNHLVFLSTFHHRGFIDRTGIGTPFLNGQKLYARERSLEIFQKSGGD